MTETEADQLKPGDIVYVSTFFVGTTPRVTCLKFRSFSSSPPKDSKERVYKYECEDGTLRLAARLHYTEAEAHKDVSNLIRERIDKLQRLLQEWE